MSGSALQSRMQSRLSEKLLKCHLHLRTASTFHVEESDSLNDGAADVELVLSAEQECLLYAPESVPDAQSATKPGTTLKTRSDTTCFQFLRNQRMADGTLLVPTVEGRVAAHIVECKKTLDPRKWSQVKEQFAGTLYRLRALSQVLELQMDQVVCYTACRDNHMVRPSPANTVHRRAYTGLSAAPATSEGFDHAQSVADLGPPFGQIRHVDIPLRIEQRNGQEVGCGRLELPAA